MALLGFRFCARAFSSCGKRGPLFIAVRGPLIIAAFLVEHRLQTCRLSSCGSRAQLLCGMWDLPRPGLEPVSPALAGGFSTTAPLRKPTYNVLFRPHETCLTRQHDCSLVPVIRTQLGGVGKFLPMKSHLTTGEKEPMNKITSRSKGTILRHILLVPLENLAGWNTICPWW